MIWFLNTPFNFGIWRIIWLMIIHGFLGSWCWGVVCLTDLGIIWSINGSEIWTDVPLKCHEDLFHISSISPSSDMGMDPNFPEHPMMWPEMFYFNFSINMYEPVSGVIKHGGQWKVDQKNQWFAELDRNLHSEWIFHGYRDGLPDGNLYEPSNDGSTPWPPLHPMTTVAPSVPMSMAPGLLITSVKGVPARGVHDDLNINWWLLLDIMYHQILMY